MWSGIGKLIGSVFASLAGAILGFFKRKKLEKEASQGRAAKEYLRTEDAAKENEDEQRKLQEKIAKEHDDGDQDEDLFKID